MNKKTKLPSGNIVIYKDAKGNLQLDVKLEKDTVWVTQKQMSQLFQKDIRTINEHIINVFKERELNARSVIRKFRITAEDGKTYKTNFYNLDVIISVGYRIKSNTGTKFRIWATRVLKRYLLQGYAINHKKLLEQKEKFIELQRAIKFLTEKSKIPLLEDQTKELLNILNDYTRSLNLLFQYDEGKLKLYKKQKPTFILNYKDSINLILQLKNKLREKKEAGSLFGQETDNKFKSTIGVIYQTFDKKELYKTVEEKAANILYLIIKDHPFVDGNKRIASILFIYFLDKNDYLWRNNYERKITDSALVALALLIAVSKPTEKEVMINLITNLI